MNTSVRSAGADEENRATPTPVGGPVRDRAAAGTGSPEADGIAGYPPQHNICVDNSGMSNQHGGWDKMIDGERISSA
jgi:hypothetical protein